MTFAGRVPGYVMRREENSNRSSFCLGTYQFKRPSATSDANSEFGPRLTSESGLSRHSDFHSVGVRLADNPPRGKRSSITGELSIAGYLERQSGVSGLVDS